ncbi:MAG: alanine racemase [Polyangiales bacterium]
MKRRGDGDEVRAKERSTISPLEQELGVSGRSRRQWMVASAAVVAGSVVACGDSGDGGTDASACAADGTAPATLPSFGSERCTNEIDSSPLPPDESRFTAWNQELRSQAGGRESAFVDLDALDHNMKLVGSQLGSRIALRLVAKSLPSVRLLEYMMVTACTNRIMAFSEGMVRDLLCRFGADVDILLGRPAAAAAAGRIFATLDAQSSGDANPAGGVRWLVDTPERLAAYRDLAEQRGSTLRIAVEIDVGLRRGGALDRDELLAMLSIIDDSSLLQFTGFMGYDGHVPFAPEGADPAREFAEVQLRYADFVQAGSDAFPALFDGPLVYNGGGSRTYHLYTDQLQTPINEVAMGSAFSYPFHFADLPEQALRRATFLASPVLKRIDPAEIPFARGLLPAMSQTNSDLQVAFYQVAAGFPGEHVFPEGLVPNPAIPGSEGVNNLLSNQAEWLGSREVALQVGDFIFYHPWEGDSVRWLSRLDVLRGGKLVDQWGTFQPGIRWV